MTEKQYIPRAHENEDGTMNHGLAARCNGCGHLMPGLPNECERCHIPFRAEWPEGMSREQAIRQHDDRRRERRATAASGEFG